MADWGCKGKGKGKGKGKSASPGHTLPRTRISAEKFTGTVFDWKGKYGWIQPAEEIEHEKAKLRGGRLFASIDDIMGAQSLDVGAEVEFHICEDEAGLGAEEVVQTGAGKPQAAGGKSGCKGGWSKDGWKGGSKGSSWDSAKGGAKGWAPAAAKGWAPPAAKGWAPPAAKGWAQAAAKGAMGGWDSWGKGGKGKDAKGKGKSKSKEGGKGHMLPKTRITAEKFNGTVAAWKGKYGWLTPAEEIAHEKASLHNGGIFVSSNDIVGVTELTVGATVEFHIAEDSSGLAAEEVVQL